MPQDEPGYRARRVRCDECGYDDACCRRADMVAAITGLAGEHGLLLRTVPAETLRADTRAGSWSPPATVRELVHHLFDNRRLLG